MFFDRPEAGRHAVLVHLSFPNTDAAVPAETATLATGAGMVVAQTVTGTRKQPHPRYYMGTGKLAEVKQALAAADADILLLNHDIGAGQQRNLEQHLDVRVMPRTELILHIFAERARTFEGQLQVELAQLEHAQTRLVRGWTHLDRQKGGIGLRGAGEKQIEMDQRMLGQRIKQARAKLKEVAARRERGRKRRQRQGAITVALVGYTNAGKSTLFNALTTGEVLAEDRLFATLDPTMRRLPVSGLGDVILADTVGFISHLPHSLVDAFRATLEEVAQADLLLHVINAAHPAVDEQIGQVEEVLTEINAHQVPTLAVLNKVDLVATAEQSERLDDIKARLPDTITVSALDGTGLDTLLASIERRLGHNRVWVAVHLHPGDSATRAWLYNQGVVQEESVADDGSLALHIQADKHLLDRLQQRGAAQSKAGLNADMTNEESSGMNGDLLPAMGIPRISPLPN